MEVPSNAVTCTKRSSNCCSKYLFLQLCTVSQVLVLSTSKICLPTVVWSRESLYTRNAMSCSLGCWTLLT